MRATFGSFTIFVLLGSSAVLDADWPRFRGADGSGVSDAVGLSVHWSDDEGLAWKTKLPGPGSSSPVISGGRVFLTCYSGYGVPGEDSGKPEDLRRHVVCVDVKNGKLLWNQSFESKLPEEPYRGIGIPNHGYASGTPAADGERVFAFFGRSGVVACDFDGKELWRASVAPEPLTDNFGSASSVVLHNDLVIVPASVECEAIVAFNKRTGEEVWRAPTTGYGPSWGTPVLVDVGERTELLVSVSDEIWGLNPRNGKLRWYAESFEAQNICTSVVVANGVVYTIGGRRGGAVAVRVGGRGDVTKTHVVWRGRDRSYVTSPVVVDDHLYWVTDRGIAHCLKIATGATVYRDQRLPDAGSVYASLLAADGKLYAVTRQSGTFVLDAKPKFHQLAHNTFASDESDFNASPAVSDGLLFLRSDRFLYALGAKL